MLIFLSGALQRFIAFDLGTPLQGIYPKEVFRCKDIHPIVTLNKNWK